MRVVLERALRLTAVAALLYAWWLTGRAPANSPTDTPNAARTDTALNAQQLAQTLADPRRQQLHLSLSAVPDAASRAVLHAASRAGVGVSWHPRDTSTGLTPLAISATPLADPSAGTVLRVVAHDSAEIALSDSVGWLDSARVQNGGVAWTLPGANRMFDAAHQGTSARAAAMDTATLGRIRLFAAPGWESRFAMRALEESGWSVDADFAIAPRAVVTTGVIAPLDTVRYAAVIALDSTAWVHAAAIERFVRSGGGLVLFADAARGSAMRTLRAGEMSPTLAALPGALQTEAPKEGLPLSPISSLVKSAVPIERSARPGTPLAIAARTVGVGRVLQVGYGNSWEWRMLGNDNAPADHRAWWQSLLHRTAFVSHDGAEQWSLYPGNVAPLADLVARVGPAAAPSAAIVTQTGTRDAPPVWLFVLAATSLLAAWWSRRLRGAQ